MKAGLQEFPTDWTSVCSYEQYFAAQNGSDLTLTLDTTIQYYLEKGLDTMTDKFAAANGATGIIMDVRNGGILAMASYPNYDLNDFSTVTDKTLLSRINSKAANTPTASPPKSMPVVFISPKDRRYL